MIAVSTFWAVWRLNFDLVDPGFWLTIFVDDRSLDPSFFQMAILATSYPEPMFMCLSDMGRHMPAVSGRAGLWRYSLYRMVGNVEQPQLVEIDVIAHRY